jgi:alanine racemase
MTHLTAGGVPEKHELNIEQLTRFKDFSNILEKQGIYLKKHCCTSRFAIRYPSYQFDYVRTGSNLFGVHSYYGTGPHFRPAMQLKARILQLKEIEEGTAVGYGPVFTAERNTKVAVLPIGYADGLSCRLGNKMHLLVHGKIVPQIGRLCMDYCMVDVTDVPDVHEGDVVTLFGEDGVSFLSVQRHAAIYSGTASELICLLGRRIPRFYYKDGKENM